METVENQTFQNERVILDGRKFVHCTFTGCTLVYTGTDSLGLDGCTMNSCRWSFEGPAGNTLEFMRAIYHHLGDAGRQIVETTFENIRRLPEAPEQQ